MTSGTRCARAAPARPPGRPRRSRERPQLRLTAHFDTAEFACHDGTPAPAFSFDDLGELALLYLEPLRRAFGPTLIVSGYRHRAYNAQVGGAADSMHIYLAHRKGAAADVRCARGQPAEWYRLLDRRAAPGLGRYRDHVHVDNRAGHARW